MDGELGQLGEKMLEARNALDSLAANLLALSGSRGEGRPSNARVLYVAGPMTGVEDLNRGAFERAKSDLEAAGYDAVHGHDINPDASLPYKALLMADIEFILGKADGIALLDGWEASPGARAEHSVASACGMRAEAVDWWLASKPQALRLESSWR